MMLFFDNIESMKLHNQAFDEGNVTFKLGINQLSDFSFDEFLKMNEVVSVEMPFDPMESPLDPDGEFPASFDWRTRGAISKIHEQNLCGMCYAFAALSALESHIFIKTGNMTELSVQEILDCAGDEYQSWGCDGGIVFRVFDYIKDHGISCDSEYPFKGQVENSTCFSTNETRIEEMIQGYIAIYAGDEDLMRQTIAKTGPIIGHIAISNEEFLRYSSGIFIQNNCTALDINHAMLLVGYGEENGIKYWIAQNSYGEAWGESGFIKVATTREGHCGFEAGLFLPVL